MEVEKSQIGQKGIQYITTTTTINRCVSVTESLVNNLTPKAVITWN